MNSANELDEAALADVELQRTAERRMFTYSVTALKLASAVDKIFVAHPAFLAALEAMDRIYQLARELTVPYGLLLVGGPGTGKTAVIRYFRQSLPRSDLIEDGLGAVSVRLQQKPTAGRTVSSLLQSLRYPFFNVTNQTVGIKKGLTIETIRAKGTRLVCVDEGHRLAAGTHKAGREDGDGEGTETSEYIRELMDEAPVGIALAGSHGLDSLDKIDKYLHSRITTRVVLENFNADKYWVAFLRAFCKQCAVINLDFLASGRVPSLMHAATKGNPRAFKQLVVEAVLVAADLSRQDIDIEVLRTAHQRVSGSSSLLSNPFGV